MRLKRDDKEYERNLRLLATASKIETIYLRALSNQNKRYLQHLDSKSGQAFKRYLEHAHSEYFLNRGEAEVLLQSTEELLDFLPDEDLIPERFEKMYSIHKHIYNNREKTNKLEQQLDEHTQLQQLVRRSKNSSAKLTTFMKDTGGKTPQFEDFCQNMLHTPESMINAKYFSRAISVAKQAGFYTDEFKSKLGKLLIKPSLRLAADSVQRTFTTSKKLLPGAALGTALTIAALAGTNALDFEAIEQSHNANNSNAYEYYNEHNHSNSNISQLNYTIVETPIATNYSINSYNDIYADFFTKTAEIYKHQTGKNISFAGYGKNNIDSATTTIYTVNYNGETQRFSTLSEYATNAKYLKEALQSVPGVTITETQTDDITYIHRYGISEAIVDSQGNPVKSGNIMEQATSGVGEMYNQAYIAKAKRNLENAGTNTKGMSEAQLIGLYILSDSYDIQNPELSAALAYTTPLAQYIDQYCFDENDPNTILAYATQSNAFTEAFNSHVLGVHEAPEISPEEPDLGNGSAVELNSPHLSRDDDDGIERG